MELLCANLLEASDALSLVVDSHSVQDDGNAAGKNKSKTANQELGHKLTQQSTPIHQQHRLL